MNGSEVPWPMMRLAFCLFEYFPFGGLQRDMLAIATACLRRGHQVTVFTRQWRGERPEGLDVRLLPVKASSNHGRDRRFADQVLLQLTGFDRSLAFNKMPGTDFYYAADGCLAATIPPLSPRRLLPRYRSRLAMERSVFAPEAATRILSISPPQKQLYLQHYGLSADRFVDVPPPIRPDRAMTADYASERADYRNRWKVADDDTVVMFVGSGFRTKGLDRALRGFARFARDGARARMMVVGSGDESAYRRLARRLGVAGCVDFLGGRDDVRQLLQAGDVLLHPAYRENTGTVLLEAMVAGLPVVASAQCGFSPYVTRYRMGEILDEPLEEVAITAALGRAAGMPLTERQQRARDAIDNGHFFEMPETVAAILEQSS